MVEFTLTSAPPLAGYHQRFGSVTLRSPDELAIVNMAIPLGKDEAAMKAVASGYGVDLPEPGISVVSKEGAARLVRLAPDQAFAIFTHYDNLASINWYLKVPAPISTVLLHYV